MASSLVLGWSGLRSGCGYGAMAPCSPTACPLSDTRASGLRSRRSRATAMRPSTGTGPTRMSTAPHLSWIGCSPGNRVARPSQTARDTGPLDKGEGCSRRCYGFPQLPMYAAFSAFQPVRVVPPCGPFSLPSLPDQAMYAPDGMFPHPRQRFYSMRLAGRM